MSGHVWKVAAAAMLAGLGLAACGGAEGRGSDQRKAIEQATEESRTLVNPCAIPTTGELRELGMPTKPYAHTVTFLENVCIWRRGDRQVSIQALPAVTDQERYFDSHDAGPALVDGAERAVEAHSYLGTGEPAGSWGRSILARNDRVVVTAGIDHRPDGVDPVPILSRWAARTLERAT